MKIGIVCYPTFGGSGVLATELGKYLARAGHEVHFITYSQPVRLDILERNIYYHEVNVEDYPLFHYQPYELALSSRMVNITLKYGLDLLHVHYAIPHAYAAYMARQILADKKVHIPVITTLHGTDITLVGKNPSYKEAVTFSINHSNVVTSVSESLRLDTLELFDIKRPIEVIPNFVDMSLYQREEPCKNNFAAPGQKIVSHISNFRPVKRVLDVIEVFYRLQSQVDSILLMIGDGPEKERARERSQSLGIAERVKFLGKTFEIERVLCMSDLFLLPSEKESFGLAALEAMAAGVPVISTNTGGLPEVNQHGITGYTTEVGAVEEMARWAINLMQDEEQHLQFAQQARERASAFDLEKIGPLYLELYLQSLKKSV